jgi:hypothetical protein
MPLLSFVALPNWLTQEGYLTLATWGLVAATILLFLITLFLYFDSRAKGREQRERWEREDESRAKEQAARWAREDRLREEDAKAKVAVELAKRETVCQNERPRGSPCSSPRWILLDYVCLRGFDYGRFSGSECRVHNSWLAWDGTNYPGLVLRQS